MKHRYSAVSLVVLLALLVMPGSTPLWERLPHPPAVTHLFDLPLPAQSTIAAALGSDTDAYHVVVTSRGYWAGNAVHRLRLRFGADGVHIGADAAEWGLALHGWGYGERLRAVTPVQPRAAANRVEYHRGAVTEWYVNGPLGLEQGFIVESAPGERHDAPLTLSLALSGDWQANADGEKPTLILTNPEGAPVLRYSGLYAFDRRGRELKAWLEIQSDAVLIRVDAANAEYPVLIDPFVARAKLTASDKAASDHFGNSVASSGDTIVVGAPESDPGGTGNAGAVYVFAKPVGGWSGNLTQSAKLIASDKTAGDRFGYSVAIHGDTVVVGASEADPGGTNAAGAAYVFVKPVGGWSGNLTQSAKLTASDKGLDDHFGNSVAISGDTIVVGAAYSDFGAYRETGAVYIFARPGGGWSGNLTQSAQLTASDKGQFDHFGRSVAIDNATVVVGAFTADPSGSFDAGAAYVFVKPGGGWSGNLTQNAKLTAADKGANDLFGSSVAISGDAVLVGAVDADPGGLVDAGAVFVFVKPGGGWSGNLTQNAKLTAADKVAGDEFGSPLAISGDTAVVGGGAGAVYVFVKQGGGWSAGLTQSAKLVAPEKAQVDSFGWSVAISGVIIAVGAVTADTGGKVDAGAAYVFDLGITYLPLLLR